MAKKNSGTDLKELEKTLLNIGVHLMSAGANTRRIRTTLERIAGGFGCAIDLLITNRALMISISDEEGQEIHSSLKRTLPHGVNFRIVSGISRMSWKILQENWSIELINAEVTRLLSLPHYPRIVILSMVSLAGAAFCRLFGGVWLDMIVAFAATFAGLFIRQELVKRNYNPYMCIFIAAFVSSIIAGLFVKYNDSIQEQALTASVLYLIPGVPLINSFSDLIHGNLMNGIVRSVNGLIIAFSIALGLMLAMHICQL